MALQLHKDPWKKQQQEALNKVGLPKVENFSPARDAATVEQIQESAVEIAKVARDHCGLDFYDTIFEVVTGQEMSEIAANTGFPVRYLHWRFGAEAEQLKKGYSYGLQKIYEMVINNNPSIAYLMAENTFMDQKLVIAHVFGHVDFFKNNQYFAHTNRNMLDQMANHAAVVDRHIEEQGYEVVEKFIESCLSIEDLIDPNMGMHLAAEQKQARKIAADKDDASADYKLVATRPYMESFINPPEIIEQEQRDRKRRKEEESSALKRISPTRDVMMFLLKNAPLKDWQHDILRIIRDEAIYFQPQGQTKIMNEGWASYWHSTMCTKMGILGDSEIVCFADHHSGTMAMSPNRLNPYKIGIELFRDIEERWNKGRHGLEYERCDDMEKKANWDTGANKGREKIFEVRKIYNDITFIDTFLTPEFCRKHKMFSFAYNSKSEHYEIASREFQEIKKQLLNALTNHGRPHISAVDANYNNAMQLLLEHQYNGVDLDQGYAQATLKNLYTLWSRPVHIRTVAEGTPIIMSYDGKEHSENLID